MKDAYCMWSGQCGFPSLSMSTWQSPTNATFCGLCKLKFGKRSVLVWLPSRPEICYNLQGSTVGQHTHTHTHTKGLKAMCSFMTIPSHTSSHSVLKYVITILVWVLLASRCSHCVARYTDLVSSLNTSANKVLWPSMWKIPNCWCFGKLPSSTSWN